MLPEPFRKPDLARAMQQIVNLDVVKPEWWAKTHGYSITAEEVQAAIDAEKAEREAVEVLRKREEVVDE